MQISNPIPILAKSNNLKIPLKSIIYSLRIPQERKDGISLSDRASQ